MVCLLIVVLIMFVLVIIVYTTKIISFLILEVQMKSLMVTKYGDISSGRVLLFKKYQLEKNM